ncbi:hypothetical protein MMPV_002293 [Pyropia vietnamensis]
MQHDEVIWATLNQHFCAFKVKTDRATFCRQKYNVSGLCNRSSCPLANSRYGTILERSGTLVLHIKTIERAHSPKNLWQKTKLSKNYAKALTQIDAAMTHWPPFLIHKAKQRLTKMTQFLLRKRKLLAGSARTVAVPIKQKTERRDAARERKAVKAAKLDNAIEAELLNRLKSGAYGDIYNFPRKQYERALGAEGVRDGEEDEDDELEDETEESEDEADGNEFEADLDSSDEDESEEEELEIEEEEESEGSEDSGGDASRGRPAPAAGAARRRPDRSRLSAEGDDDADASGSSSGSSGTHSGSDSEDSDMANGVRVARVRSGGKGAAVPAGRKAVADLEDLPGASEDVFAFDDGSDIEAAVAAAGGDERAVLRSRSRKRLAAAAPGAAATPARRRVGAAAAAAAAVGAASPPATLQHPSKRVRFSDGDGGGCDGDCGGSGGEARAATASPTSGVGAAAARRSSRRATPRRVRPPRPAAADAGVRVEVEVETERGETVWEAAGV